MDHDYPTFGDSLVRDVDTHMVLRALEPIWKTKTVTASRVRGRIESVLDWAKVKDYRAGDNPARWRGHLDHLLPAVSKVHKVENHTALPREGIPEFMAKLRKRGKRFDGKCIGVLHPDCYADHRDVGGNRTGNRLG